MPVDTCITNVGEYYSSHYLDSTFTKDVKQLVKRWKEEGSRATPRKLQSLGTHYFRAKGQALEETDPARRSEAGDEVASWHHSLLDALGYHDLQRFDHPVEGGDTFVPCLGRVKRYNQPWLVICEAPFCLPDAALKEGQPSEDPLEMEPAVNQLADAESGLCAGDWSRCLSRLFTEEYAPRWVLLVAGSQALLIDSHTFAQGRYLAFDLDDALGRNERATFDHLAAFLSAETLCPEGESDTVLHDTIEEQSHRFAHGVTEALQFAVREAIELLVNEWADDRRDRQLSLFKRRASEILPDGTEEITAEHLRQEALTFVYRLLFCLYAEARGGELGILPIEDDTYRLGYSFEALRDLELVPLSPQTESGTYFQNHLFQLFKLIHEGFNPPDTDHQQTSFLHADHSFSMRPLTATLFAPASTPLLNRANLSNRCLQQVIRRLSLSVDEKSKSRGRVNYAELGINQLGSVYEGLLSYKGMWAEEDLLHVKRAKDSLQDAVEYGKKPTWFVPVERRDDFKKDEIERLGDGRPRIYKQGTFILHLSGIDREKSASYYTPGVLTKCLVEEALRELLKDCGPEDADKILELTICEPAMGSASFLNEATQQLAEHYLELKQEQLGERIEPSRYPDELRRVKHYIATRNTYGVDLNPTAVELGALSLWLGCMHRLLIKEGENGARDEYRTGTTPWFGLRLRCGNSLIGARRAVWTKQQLLKGEHAKNKGPAPRLLKPGEARGEDEIYHFLVFDPEMAPTHTDKLMRKFWPEKCGVAKKWIQSDVKARWSPEETTDALAICDLIDQHWGAYTKERANAIEASACTATVWPTPSDSKGAVAVGPSLEEQERNRAQLESSSGSFQRLKLVMDAWCSLWFWPLDTVDEIPSREAFLAAARLLLGETMLDALQRELLSARLGFDIDALLAASQEAVPEANVLAAVVPWLGQAQELASQQRFHHWELVFPEVMGPKIEGGGFDLIVGNPPWVKVQSHDASVLCELEPLLGVRSEKSAGLGRARGGLLEAEISRTIYSKELRRGSGEVTALNSRRLYPKLSGLQTNYYKCFITRVWALLGSTGIGALIHEEGVFDDPKGGQLRREYYRRIVSHLQFKNELDLFLDVDHHKIFGLTVFRGTASSPEFNLTANLYHPATIASSRAHDRPNDPLPGIKTDDGHWETRGHCSRLVRITKDELALFARLFEPVGTPALEARLPQVHSREIVKVLCRFAEVPRRLADLGDAWTAGVMFDETYGQRDGIITRETDPTFQPDSPDQWVLSGPHFYVGNPMAKTARTTYSHRNDYEDVDLTGVSDGFVPRSVYRPGDRHGSPQKFKDAIPVWPEGADGYPVTSKYRHVNRQMCHSTNERTLISAIIPRGVTAIHAVVLANFLDHRDLVLFSGFTFSIPFDYLIKTTGKGHVWGSDLAILPFLEGVWRQPIVARSLRLSCLTGHYADLWAEVADQSIRDESWATDDQRMANEFELPWAELNTDEWAWKTPLRSEFARRQALLEIDVLVAMAISLALEELQSIRIQFPVMRQYELADLYDARGRRLPNTNRKDAGGTQIRDAMKDWDSESPLTVSWGIDNGLQTVTKTFIPPFTPVDREADYAEAWKEFSRRFDQVPTEGVAS